MTSKQSSGDLPQSTCPPPPNQKKAALRVGVVMHKRKTKLQKRIDRLVREKYELLSKIERLLRERDEEADPALNAVRQGKRIIKRES